MSTVINAPELLRAVGLVADGPAVLGRPVRAGGRGVYLVELPAPLPSAPLQMTRIGKWIERVPELRLDGERPTSRALAARLASFWIPSSLVVFVGGTGGSIAGRLTALERHVLGDRRPHAAGQWLQILDLTGARVWWATTGASEEYEDAILAAFAERVPAEQRAALHDPDVVLPFANLRLPGGSRKRHGISGAVLPEEAAPSAPATRVVEIPPGDAEGARAEPRGTGRQRTERKPAARRAPAQPRPSGERRADRAAAARPTEPVYVSAEGMTRLRAELEELVRVRRPEVIARIRSAKELGDLKENADYAAAREEQSFLEGRIQALEGRLRAAVLIDAPTQSARIVLGSRVSAETEGSTVELMIVGSSESDPAAGRISSSSPVGRALLGRSVGDEVVVKAPTAEIHYRITAIE